MNQALYAHMNNKRKMKKKEEIKLISALEKRYQTLPYISPF
jgi:hypothetical protein